VAPAVTDARKTMRTEAATSRKRFRVKGMRRISGAG
jgi:hypothetical protein